ncbi:MAG: hypothetical protein ABIJ37_00610 [Pseudomonadota bacterium]
MYFQRRLSLTLVLATVVLTGCASGTFLGLNKAQITNQLKPGMTYREVVSLLGEPKSSQVVNGKWIVRWSLHQNFKGWVPYDMKFNQKKKTLISWSVNEAEYEKNQCALAKLAKAFEEDSKGVGSGDPGPNDPQLMKWIAGYYYSYTSAGMGSSGGTERKIMLCPDGTFYINTESGYSGGTGTSEAWGAVGSGGHRGRWAIQGNQQQGTLTMVSPQGNKKTYNYRACGRGCFYFDGLKVGYAGPPKCN